MDQAEPSAMNPTLSAVRRPKYRLLKIAAGTALFFVAVVAAVLAFIYSGLFDIAATTPHYAATHWAMRTVMVESVRSKARGVQVPELDDPEKVHAGFQNFHAMCVVCHGAPGVEPSEISKGLYPQPPDLAQAAKLWTPAELFVIIKYGIKMSGMPAWEQSHSGDEIWSLVAFLKVLPTMSVDEYQAAVEFAAPAGKGEGMRH